MHDRTSFARRLRKQPTDTETRLWRRLRNRQIAGVRFRRQCPLGPYIVDFVSYDPRLAIELDGGQHAESGNSRRDAARDRWLEKEGFTVLRFWDSEVLQELEAVLTAIVEVIERRGAR